MSKLNERSGIRGWLRNDVTRRRFIELSGAVGVGAAVLSKLPVAHAGPSVPDPRGGTLERTACMMCNAGCGMQVRVKDGVALHIEGNAYDPQANHYSAGTNVDASGYVTEAAVADAAVNGGSLCPRGAGALATLYDPLRLRTPLKRSGPRGSGQWEAISWQQAIREICWGAMLPDGAFQGLAAIRDNVNKFSSTDTAYVDDAPQGNPANYGYKANQLVMMVGRDQIGEATGRFMSAFGSINRLDHTALCNSSYKLAGYLTYCKESAATGTYNFKPDIDGADVLVFFGTNPVEANAPTNTFVRKLSAFRKRGGRLIIIDPTFTNSAAKADKWIGSIKVGTDLALALAICRGIIDTAGFSLAHLQRSHAPGTGANYKSWYDAPYLVNQTTHKFVSCADAGLTPYVGRLRTALGTTAVTTIDLEDADGGAGTLDLATWPSKGQVRVGGELFYYTGKVVTAGAKQLTGVTRAVKWTGAAAAAPGAFVSLAYVCSRGGTLMAYHDTSGGTLLPDLEVQTTIGADTAVSAFKMFKDSLDTVANYSAICGVPQTEINDLVTELTDTSKKVCVDMYRGAFSHTNGTYTAQAIHMINKLLDRVDRAGGYALGKRLKAGTAAVNPPAPATAGVRLDRAKGKFDPVDSTRKPVRPWFPLGYYGVQQEVWPSVKIGYPYPIKALITFTSNPAYTTPFNHTAVAALLDRGAVPLHVAVDIFMSETTALADYILPDTTFLEKWGGGMTTGYATSHITGSALRRPVVGTIDPTSRAYSPALPGTKTMDDILIALALELGLPGYGKDGMGSGKDLYQAWHFWNEVYRSGDLGMTTGLSDLTHAVLKMGGKFKDPSLISDGVTGFINADAVYGGLISLYSEKLATTKHSYTKAYFSGVPIWVPPHKNWKDVAAPASPAGLNLKLINFKKVHHTQSRSTSNVWLREISPENSVWIHPSDANDPSRNIKDGDMVRVRSSRYSAIGRARVTESAQPGTVVVPYHYGRWELGARLHRVDGVAQRLDPIVARGIAVNPLQEPDSELRDVCYTDPIGGSAEFYSTNVAVEKV